MSSTYRGLPANVASNLPGSLSISSSTNASPIQITTSTNHGLITGDEVSVSGHQTNTNANGQRTVTVTGVNTFTLDGSTTSGSAGGATGSVQPLILPSFQIPSDGTDDMTAASVNVPFEAEADRGAFVQVMTGAYKLRKNNGVSNNNLSVSANWTCTISATNTVTDFTGTGLPVQATTDSFTNDLVEVQLDTTLLWDSATAPNTGVFVGLEFATQQPGGSLSSYTRLLGSAKYFQPQNPAVTQYLPITLTATIFVNASKPIVKVQPFGFIPTGLGTGSVYLVAEYVWTIRQYRPTGVPQ